MLVLDAPVFQTPSFIPKAARFAKVARPGTASTNGLDYIAVSNFDAQLNVVKLRRVPKSMEAGLQPQILNCKHFKVRARCFDALKIALRVALMEHQSKFGLFFISSVTGSENFDGSTVGPIAVIRSSHKFVTVVYRLALPKYRVVLRTESAKV